MTKNEFVAKCIDFATKQKTLYVLGGFGQKLTPYYKEYFIAHYGFNRCIDAYGRNRKELIMNASPDTFAFDCVCFVKSVINGSKGYTTSPCPDISIAALIRRCTNVREISNTIEPNVGDFLTFRDYSHCGIYIGNGKVAEVTYRWKDGAQIAEYAGRGWKYAGDLEPFFDAEPKPDEYVHAVQVMACKQKSNAKKYLRKGQSTYFVDDYYKNAYVFSNVSECEKALADIRVKYPDAFITKYKAKDLVIL